ncbi:MAG: hypothetical protein ACM3MD_00515 [Betaproteobacteria bacterium]
MDRINIQYTGAMLLMLGAILTACVPGKQLITRPADPAEVKGTYTLLLYGCHYPADIKNVAILIDEGSRYPLEIYDLDTSYKVKKGVPAQQALSEADSFVRCSTHRIWQTHLLRIPDDGGGTIGYEIRPLYLPLEFGLPDVLRVSYALKDGMVRAYIRLDPNVEKELEESGSKKQNSLGK